MESEMRDKLILIGFMGTGKSSVSRGLAERLGWERVDVDEEIEKAEGRTIASIFSDAGEEAFRTIESSMLRTIAEDDRPAVVATGGGAVLSSENRDCMKTNGFVVALQASPEMIISRVMTDSSRPLLAGGVSERVHRLLEERRGAYDFAHYSIDTTELSVDDVVSAILREWNSYSVIQ
ncbi:shikimate kinase [Paenibacillus sp. GCM10027627]|uniref:shikimate kinase n=1 Tax=unclassified Paenibacillus TaxID=185978 RepID=UPI00362AC003